MEFHAQVLGSVWTNQPGIPDNTPQQHSTPIPAISGRNLPPLVVCAVTHVVVIWWLFSLSMVESFKLKGLKPALLAAAKMTWSLSQLERRGVQ